MQMLGIQKNGWFWYLTAEAEKLDVHKCGKWMFFFDDQEFAKQICLKAIEERVCWECKCSNLKAQGTDTGVVCFYQNGDDVEHHKLIIGFMLRNNLIRKTKTGKYYNNSFKFDDQTRAGEYGGDFEGKIKLDEFIDLRSGEWIRK